MEFFSKSMLFKVTLGGISFPTGINPHVLSKDIPGKAKLEMIINLVKDGNIDMNKFLVDTNAYELFRFADYMKSYDEAQSKNTMNEYLEHLAKSYKRLNKYMKTVEVPSGYNMDVYNKIRSMME